MPALLLTLLCLLLVPPAGAAAPPPDASFAHVSAREGLSHDSVTALLQDRDGFLWVGTSAGLNRYDGQRVVSYRSASGLVHHQITCLLQGADDALWIGTHDGVSRLDPRSGRFTSWRHCGAAALSNRHITALAQTPDGLLWIAGPAGLDRLDPRGGPPLHLHPGLRIEHMLQRPDGALWLASQGRLLRLDRESDGPRAFALTEILALAAPQQIRALFQDEGGALWLSATGDRALGRLDPATGAWRWFAPTRSSDPPLEALSLASDRRGGVFLGARKGLWHLDLGSGSLTLRYQHHPQRPDGLPGEAVSALLGDRQEGLWVGTYAGLGRLDLRRPRFARYRPGLTPEQRFSGEEVWALLEAQDGALWVGGSQGLTRLDRTAPAGDAPERFTTEPDVGDVRALHQDQAGRLYVATHSGLLIVEGAQRTWLRPDAQDPQSLPDERLSSLLAEGQDDLFVGGNRAGLARLALRTRRVQRYPCAAVDPRVLPCKIMALAPAGAGLLWVGGLSGLALFDPRAGRVLRALKHHTNDPRSLSRSTIISLRRGRDGALWVGSSGGLNRLPPSSDPATQPAQFTRFTAPQLPDDVINGVIEDQAGQVWLTTNDGLLRLDPRSGAVQRFDTLDGLASNEFNQGAVATTRAGEVLIGGVRGFNVFHPAAVTPDPQPPEVRITAVRQNGRPLLAPPGPAPPEVALGAQLHRLELDFSVLGFDRSQRVRASYRMEGLESDWTETSAAGTVTYGALPPGRYRFQVRGKNADGVWNLSGAALSFHVGRTWWSTRWARGLLLLCSLLLVHYAYRLRLTSLRRRGALLETKVAERTAALLRLQQEAVAAGQAKSQFLALMSHEIRTPLHAIIGLTNLLRMTALDAEQTEMLQTMRSSGDLLLSLINDILDFSKIESGKLELRSEAVDLRACLTESLELLQAMAESKGLQLRLDVAAALPARVRLDPTRLRQVLINLVGNSVKFSDRGEISVQVQGQPRADGHELQITVRDHGPGIPAALRGALFQPFVQGELGLSRRGSGTGLGLVICRRLCELMGGRIWLEDTAGPGATFVFVVVAQHAGAEELPPAARPPLAALHLKVLLCEDQPVNQRVIRRMLTHLQCQVHVVNNGQEGLRAVQAARYDVVLMDVMMPEMDGLTATRRIRQLAPQPGGRPWIIAMSAGALLDQQQRCREAGMDDFLAKPTRLDELEQALQRAALAGSAHAAPAEDAPAPEDAAPRDDDIEAYLNHLEQGLPGMRQELIEDFSTTLPQRAQQIAAAIAAADWEGLRILSHGAKGAVGFIGAQHLRALLGQLEEAAQHHDEAQVRALKEQVPIELSRVVRVLQALAQAG